jgi:uncharacterized membrane protein
VAGRRRLLARLVAVVGVAGVAVSLYLTFVHYAAAPLVCSAGGAVDCERVLTSGFAVIGGSAIPTSAAGIVWFTVSTAIAIARGTALESPFLSRAQLAWSAAGVATVIALVFVEIVMLGAICIWCTVAHALAVLTFVLVVMMRSPSGEGDWA